MYPKIREKLLKQKLNPRKLEKEAKAKGFIKRIRQEGITAYGFIAGFFKMFSKGKNSLSDWAQGICEVTGHGISRQSLENKFYGRHEQFIQAYFEQELKKNIKWKNSVSQPVLTQFSRVLVEDSSCISINAALKENYPSSYTKTGKAATLRIQNCYEIKGEKIETVSIQSFRDNDQKQAPNILNHAQAGDLVLRDLGYFVLGVFAQMNAKGVYFISKLRANTNVYSNAKTKEKLNLLEQLKRSDSYLDTEVYVGNKQRLKVRLIAERLPQEVADEKRRKARKERHSKTNHSKEYYERLGWTISISNVPKNLANAEEILKLYRLRWRIEIMFKAWKTGLNLSHILSVKMNLVRFNITLMLSLIYIIIFCQPAYRELMICNRASSSHISLVKFYKWFGENFNRVVCLKSLDYFELIFGKEIRRNCNTSIQKSRISYSQFLYGNFLN